MINPKLRVVGDILLSISFIVTAITGLVLKFGFAKGIPGQTLFLIEKHTWTLMHDYFGIALIILTILHFILYWNIIRCAPRILYYKKQKK